MAGNFQKIKVTTAVLMTLGLFMNTVMPSSILKVTHAEDAGDQTQTDIQDSQPEDSTPPADAQEPAEDSTPPADQTPPAEDESSAPPTEEQDNQNQEPNQPTEEQEIQTQQTEEQEVQPEDSSEEDTQNQDQAGGTSDNGSNNDNNQHFPAPHVVPHTPRIPHTNDQTPKVTNYLSYLLNLNQIKANQKKSEQKLKKDPNLESKKITLAKDEKSKKTTIFEKNFLVPTDADYKGSWAEKYIVQLYSKGVVTGCSKHNYCPDKTITRAELLKIVIKLFGIPTADKAETQFTDIKGHWAANFVVSAYVDDLVSGFQDNTFRPDAEVTRAEALKIVFKAANFTIDDTLPNPFVDISESDWFYGYAVNAYAMGIVKGETIDGNVYFMPNSNLTRAELAQIAIIALGKVK